MAARMSTNPLEIDCRSVKTKLDTGADLLLLDCREKSEYDTVKISQAVLLPMTEVQARAGELDAYKNREVIVHCHHGGRSLRVAKFLLGLGFTNVKSMAGGIDEWALTIEPTLPRY
jgi:rhodanese-related sulfurtransferase